MNTSWIGAPGDVGVTCRVSIGRPFPLKRSDTGVVPKPTLVTTTLRSIDIDLQDCTGNLSDLATFAEVLLPSYREFIRDTIANGLAKTKVRYACE